MFRRLHDSDQKITVHFEGEPVVAAPGDTVAAALLAHGVLDLRTTPVSDSPRGPWCLIGDCFDCLVEIDGRANLQACQVIVADGMKIRRQKGVREVKL